jgi:predicted nucleotidyltransferase
MIGKLTDKETKAVQEFKNLIIHQLKDRIKSILLFGSKARGNFNKESDIDIFILVDASDSRLRKIIASSATDILIKYGILLSPKIIEVNHFSFLRRLGTAFAKNIEKEGIPI